MRVFLDTNVIVSAVATRGLCADVSRAVLPEHELVTCAQVLEEVARILMTKLSVPAELARELLELLAQDSIMSQAQDLPNIEIQDKDDLAILAASVGGQADVLVTGDTELLGIRTMRTVRILSPRAFWEELAPGRGGVAKG